MCRISAPCGGICCVLIGILSKRWPRATVVAVRAIATRSPVRAFTAIIALPGTGIIGDAHHVEVLEVSGAFVVADGQTLDGWTRWHMRRRTGREGATPD
eukprot:scaffold19958_cov30-Tisochrysis_lutea.AAC.2